MMRYYPGTLLMLGAAIHTILHAPNPTVVAGVVLACVGAGMVGHGIGRRHS